MIETDQLTKTYGGIRAVDNISFKVEPGEVLGFLGPNGAGKSTTMKMIAGFVEPTSGRALIDGIDVSRDPVACKSRIGYLPEGAPSYGEMTVRDFLSFIADMRQLSKTVRATRFEEVIGQLHLEPVLQQSIETLSKGFKRRVGLAQAILHDPKILILDEPTDGLDPNQKFEVRKLIRAMAADKIIVVSTHILEEVTAVCTRAIIIARGQLLADESPQSLQAQAPAHNRIRMTLADEQAAVSLHAALKAHSGVSKVTRLNSKLTVDPVKGRNILGEIATVAAKQEIELGDTELLSGRLDDVFRSITQGGDTSKGETQQEGVQS